MAKLKVNGDDNKTITIRVPIAIRKLGSRKLVISPDGGTTSAVAAGRSVDNALVKAIARAFRWQTLLENGTYCTIAEIAEAEKINETYVGRILRLAMLAPDLVEEFITGTVPERVTLKDLMASFPLNWRMQRRTFHRNT